MSTELIVTLESKQIVRVREKDGGEQTGQIELSTLRLATIGMFQDWLRAGKISDRKELRILGTHLYETIFSKDVGNFLVQTLRGLHEGERLRIQLSFGQEAADLASLPWEYLYYPGTETERGFFFATHVELVLSRYIPLTIRRSSMKPEKGPLRILIVVSQPQDLAPVIAAPVLDAIQRLTEKYPIMIETLTTPTIDNLPVTLAKAQPHVLHFIGHGHFNQEERKGEIALLDSEDQAASASWCPDQTFAEFFVGMRAIPHLVFLHLCESAKVDFKANFAGMAPQLILAKIQAVVAMQYPITNQAAIVFSKAFYAELARGEPIDTAVQAGRWRIATSTPNGYDNRVFGTPVLYMRSYDGIIQPLV